MKKQTVVYLPEEFADWEGAFLLPELRQVKRDLMIVSETGSPVKSIGGLNVSVEKSVSEIKIQDIEALVLIGSDSWAEPEKNKAVLKLAKDCLQSGVLVAAICAATVALAREGLLENKRHTSNDLGMLKQLVPTYSGERNYIHQLAVTDGNLITASGIGAIEFAAEFMKYFKIYNEEKRKQWFAMFKNGVQPPLEFWSSN